MATSLIWQDRPSTSSAGPFQAFPPLTLPDYVFTHGHLTHLKTVFLGILENEPCRKEFLYWDTHQPKILEALRPTESYGKKITYVQNTSLLHLLESNVISQMPILDHYQLDFAFYDVQKLFDQAHAILTQHTPWVLELCDLFRVFFIPSQKRVEGRLVGGSGSSPKLFGLIHLTLYNLTDADYLPLYLAETIVHEVAHHVLNVYNFCDPLFKNPHRPVYSSIRKVNRPAICSLQACMANAYMMHLVVCFLNGPDLMPAHSVYPLVKRLQKSLEHQNLSLKAMKKTTPLTDFGWLILGELEKNANFVGGFL